MEITASLMLIPDDNGRWSAGCSMMQASFRLSYSGRVITEKNGELDQSRKENYQFHIRLRHKEFT